MQALMIAPYLAWMALMLVLPSTAWAYAARSAVVGILLIVFFALGAKRKMPSWSSIAWGIGGGLLVCLLWIWPENFEVYRKVFILGEAASSGPSPYDPAVCGWALTIAKLIGSAFVIAPAEELFFRSFLYRWIQGGEASGARIDRFDITAFLWTVALFALEHNRYLAGAMAGAIYGLLAIRKSLAAAIIAHIVTNLALAIYVIRLSAWSFW